MGGPPPSLSLGQCEVCEKEAKSRCAGCFQSFYCSKEHQVKAWPTHRATCAPIKVCQNDKVGRFYVATRDIKPGEIVLREHPLVVGPSQATPPVCVGCFKVNLLTFMRPHTFSCIRATRFICMQNIIVLSEWMSWTAADSLIGNCAQPEVDLETDVVDYDEHIFYAKRYYAATKNRRDRRDEKRAKRERKRAMRSEKFQFGYNEEKERNELGKFERKSNLAVSQTEKCSPTSPPHADDTTQQQSSHSERIQVGTLGRHITFFSCIFIFWFFLVMSSSDSLFFSSGRGSFKQSNHHRSVKLLKK